MSHTTHRRSTCGIERAQVVRQPLGQHGNHAARKIHRVAARLRFAVERVAVRDVVAHVGDRDEQAESAFRRAARRLERLAVDRVVEVPRGLAVDGHERQMRARRCARRGRRPSPPREKLAQPLDFAREDVRQIVLAQRDLDLHARVGVVAEHFDHAPDRLHVLRGLHDDLDRDDLAGLGARSRRAG